MSATMIEHSRAREAQERAAAGAATHEAARDAHLALAERHADRAWSVENGFHQPGA